MTTSSPRCGRALERRRTWRRPTARRRDSAKKERTPEQMEAQRKQREVVVELSEQKMLRAAYSERQLQEVLTDFWFNHFNVDARKGADAVHADRVRARRDPAARARQVPRSARRDREEPGDALLSRQLDERRSRTARIGDAGAPSDGAAAASAVAGGSHRRAPDAAQQAERAEGAERELRPRADGAAHARRRRRLHAEGRHRGGARVHRLDDRRIRARAAASASSRACTTPARRSCSAT